MILWFILTLFALSDLKIHYYPEQREQYISIRLSLEGAWQEQIEMLLTDPLERELRMLEELSEIRSFSGGEKGRIIMRLKEDADLNKVRHKIQEITERFPLPLQAERPVIETGDRESTPVFVVILENEEEISTEELKAAFSAVRGCGRIDTGGAQRKDLVLTIPDDRLISLGLTPLDTAEDLRDRSTPVLIPMLTDRALSLDSRFTSPGDGESIIVGTGQTIEDLGKLSITAADSEYISRLNGEEKTLLWVRESGDMDTAGLCRSLRKICSGYSNCVIVHDRGELIERALTEVLIILLISAATVSLITALLVRKLLPVVLLCLNLPFSLGGCLAFHRLMAWDTDILTLAGLALSAGMIIDAGIIYLESGYLRSRSPLISSLLSTLLVFLVFIFAPDSLLVPCLSLIRSCSLSLIFSTIFILFVMHGILDHLKPVQHRHPLMLKPINASLSKAVLLLFFIISLPSVLSIPINNNVSLPDDSLSFSLEYEAGLPKETLALKLRNFEQNLQEKCILVSAAYKDEKASFQVRPREGILESDLKELIRSELIHEPAYLHFQDESITEPGYTVRLFARDRELLYSETKRLSNEISKIISGSRIIQHYKRRLPVILLRLNRDAATASELSEIYAVLNQKLSSPVLAKWYPPQGYDSQRVYDLRIRDIENSKGMASLMELRINKYQKLHDLVEVSRQNDFGTIEHYAGRRSVSFSVFSKEETAQTIYKKLHKLLMNHDIPTGLKVSHGQDLREKLYFKKRVFSLLLLSLVLLFLLLTGIFEGIRLPAFLELQVLLTELFTLAVLRLLNISLSAPVVFALILNAGLSLNNGLLVFDSFRAGGLPSMTEVLDSLSSCLNTLIAAGLTTLAGLVPLLFQNSGSEELLSALSITIALGLIISPLVLYFMISMLFKIDL